MAAPNDASVFSPETYVFRAEGGRLSLSNELSKLLIQAREQYAWPKSITAKESQQKIIDLEKQVRIWIGNLSSENTCLIMEKVAEWGGNNAKGMSTVRGMSPEQGRQSAEWLGQLLDPGSARLALLHLTSLPGIDLVMASKIYRFCAPETGAAIDRHCSYFFNSLCRISASRIGREPALSSSASRMVRSPGWRVITMPRGSAT